LYASKIAAYDHLGLNTKRIDFQKRRSGFDSARLHGRPFAMGVPADLLLPGDSRRGRYIFSL
jgi:hypothetical protein